VPIYRRFGTVGGLLALLAILALPMWGWEKTRSAYRREADTIRQRIASAPKLHHVNDPPSAILVRGYSFPEADFGVTGCFDQLFLDAGNSIGKWNPSVGNRRDKLPDRYLELDADDDRRSLFGDRHKTARRGPYELWLIQGNRRSLVDVFFLTEDGWGVVPSPLPLHCLQIPAQLPASARNTELLAFLNHATGQCAKKSAYS
jgi:hypothetical protein